MMAATLATTQQASLAPVLLERREMLNLERAHAFLAGRLRTRTPLGAAEYLHANLFAREAYDERLRVAVTVCSLYRDMFALQYAQSQSPLYSLKREQEFYVLCDRHAFPLGDVEAEIARDPSYFLPAIPFKGMQEHTWAEGAFDLSEIETAYKVAQVLSTRAGRQGWPRLAQTFGLDSAIAPAPPLCALGWNLFTFGCRLDGTPLCYLPGVFHVTNYSTGNVYLDTPAGLTMGVEWSQRKVGELFMARREASRIMACVAACDAWLEESPRERIGRAVEVWNVAGEIERGSPYAGMMVEEGQAMAVPELRALYELMKARLMGR